MNDRRAWLEELEESVAAYEREVADATRAVEAAKGRLTGAELHLRIAKDFLELERGRFAANSPLDGLGLKELCIRAIRDKGRATIKEIIEWLGSHGVKLDTKYPGRAIHAALMHATGVKKVAPRTYEAI